MALFGLPLEYPLTDAPLFFLVCPVGGLERITGVVLRELEPEGATLAPFVEFARMDWRLTGTGIPDERRSFLR